MKIITRNRVRLKEPYHICDFCTDAEVPMMDRIASCVGMIELCAEHVKLFTGWNGERYEAEHAPEDNHIGAKMQYIDKDGHVIKGEGIR